MYNELELFSSTKGIANSSITKLSGFHKKATLLLNGNLRLISS